MNKRPVHLEDVIPLAQEVIASGRAFRISITGTSMNPMLIEGSSAVEIVAAPERLSKFDLPLYRRDDGSYVLHRVVRVGDTYTCIGDNQFDLEPGIRHDQIIGVVKSFTRKGKHYTVSNFGYRCYCCIWHISRPVRRVLRVGVNFLRQGLKK